MYFVRLQIFSCRNRKSELSTDGMIISVPLLTFDVRKRQTFFCKMSQKVYSERLFEFCLSTCKCKWWILLNIYHFPLWKKLSSRNMHTTGGPLKVLLKYSNRFCSTPWGLAANGLFERRFYRSFWSHTVGEENPRSNPYFRAKPKLSVFENGQFSRHFFYQKVSRKCKMLWGKSFGNFFNTQTKM